jgi:long-chain acyl-CoA synthetase
MLVGDDRPEDVLAALESPGPVAVLDHRRPSIGSLLGEALPQAPDGTWLVALTSGSSAAPRAVCRTRASWQAGVAALADLTGVGPGSRVLVPGPLSSTLFLHAAWHARQVGAEPVLAALGTAEPWDVVHLVPHLLDRLLRAGDDLAGRTAVVAGAALPAGLARRASRRGLRVVSYYGAAELSFVAAGRGSGPLAPFPGVEVQVRAGMLWARSPYLCSGYLPLPAGRVPPVPGPLQCDGDGWATVGDRASLVPGGLLVHGRPGTAVQTGGATVHVADVEAVLRDAPGVADVAVVATPHPDLGEVVTAVVDAGEPGLTARRLRAWARPRLSAEQRPRRWLVVDALPRTAAGKVDRSAVQRLVARHEPPRATP